MKESCHMNQSRLTHTHLLITGKARPHRSSWKFEMPVVWQSMSKETNVYEKSPAREICIHEKRDHTDHQGNSRCLRYYAACQKRPICMKRALQKDIYLHEKRYHTDHHGNSTCLRYKIHFTQNRKEPHSTQNCCKSVKNKKQTLDGPSKTGHSVIVVYIQLHTKIYTNASIHEYM